VRQARAAERFAVLALARDFHAASGIPLAFDPAHAARTVADHIEDPRKLALVLVVDGVLRGVLAASVALSPLSPVLVAQEVIWWIAPAHRGCSAVRMLRAYETWAGAQGCAGLGVSGLNDPRVARLYGRAGFDLIENKFLKMVG
jgi:RimJ/RimL family protein N-acetyltransferase